MFHQAPRLKSITLLCSCVFLILGASFNSFALYNNGEDGGSYDNRTATPTYGADTQGQSFSGTNYIGYRNTSVPTSSLRSSTFNGTNYIHGGSNMITSVSNSSFSGSGGADIIYTDWNDSTTTISDSTFNQVVDIDADATGQVADAVLEVQDSTFTRAVTLNASGANATSSSGYVSLEGNTFSGGFTLNSDNVNLSIGSSAETQTIIGELSDLNDTADLMYENQGLINSNINTIISSLFNTSGSGFQGLATQLSSIEQSFSGSLTTLDNHLVSMNNYIGGLIATTNSTLSTISSNATSRWTTFWGKYNPDGSGWQYYDTTTKQPVNSGLKSVFYKITEYTGKTYEWLTREDQGLEDSADSLDQKLTQLESAESVVTQNTATQMSSFSPDLGAISNLSAIGWVSNYLQQVFLALGSFQIPIMVSLFLGVGMQFIGYFRFK